LVDLDEEELLLELLLFDEEREEGVEDFEEEFREPDEREE